MNQPRILAWLCLALVAPGLAQADAPATERIARARATAAEQPADLEVQLGLVRVLVEADRPQEALEALGYVDALAPRSARARLWRARALVALGRVEAAEATLRDATEPAALALRGELRQARGAWDDALDDYRVASAAAPSIALDLRTAQLLERMARADEAMTVLEGGVARTGSAVLRVEWIEIARRSGRTREALRQVDALLAAAPSARFRVLRAELLHEAGDATAARRELAEAEAAADAAVTRRPSAMTLTERARVRAARGDRRGAERDLRQALRLAPDWPTARRLLGSLEAGR